MPNEQLLFSTEQKEPLAGGHSLCAGCAASVIVRQVSLATEHPIVVASATGCLEVCTGIYPNSSWNVSWIHNAFANAAATLSGVETAYRALRKRGEIPEREIKFVAFGGDGGTYDIGLQSLSGALERGHDMVYVCVPPETELLLSNGHITTIGEFTESTLADGTPQAITNNGRHIADSVTATGEIASWVQGAAAVQPIQRAQRMPAPPELIEIETATGSKLRLTPEHNILVDGSAGPSWKPAGKVAIGDEVYTPRTLKINGDDKPIYLIDLLEDTIGVILPEGLKTQLKQKLRARYGSVAEAARALGLKQWQWKEKSRRIDLGALKVVAQATATPWATIRELVCSFRVRGGKPVNLINVQMSADLLYQLGLIASDGHISSQPYHVTFVNAEQSLLNAFTAANEACFTGRKVSRTRAGSTWHYTVSNPVLWMVANALDIKHDPKRIIRLSPDLIAAFLRGVFDGDGHASVIQGKHSQETRLLLSTTHPVFSQRLRLLLQRLGIASQIIRHPVHYDIWISDREDIGRFIAQVGTHHAEKRNQLEHIQSVLAGRSPRGKHFARAPIACGEMLKTLCQEQRVPVSAVSKKIFSLAAGTERTTKRKVQKYITQLAELSERPLNGTARHLEILLNEDFFLDPVRRVERVSANCQFVYDITVAESHTFVPAGGFVISNCYDNGAYMNTGVQRSSATPLGAHTTTSPVGSISTGKSEIRKDLTAIAEAHGIPYIAQSTPGYYMDLMRKAKRAFEVEGPAFLNVISPCPLGWSTDSADSLVLARLAADTCVWPLFEIDHGEFTLTYRPLEKKSVVEWLKPQGRFSHLFKGDHESLIAEIQAEVDQGWQKLLQRAGERVLDFVN